MTFESNIAIFVPMKNDLPINVKALCRRRGWQLKDLAAAMGSDPAALTRAMRGNPTLDTIERMANALNVSPSRLVKRYADVTGYVTVNGKDSKFDSLDELADSLSADITPRNEKNEAR